jgi:hypothetical protein
MSRPLHNPAARAEASTGPQLTIVDVSTAAGGRSGFDGRWLRVQGPHLRAVRSRHARNRTGCPGVSFSVERRGRKTYQFFYVNLGRRNRRFNITTLGREEAWRRAIKLRAEHEARVEEINHGILLARKNAAGAALSGSEERRGGALAPTPRRGRRTSARGLLVDAIPKPDPS